MVEPEQKELALSNQTVKYLYPHRSQLVYENELLYYRWSDDLGDKLLFVVPESLKEEVMPMSMFINKFRYICCGVIY